MFNIGDYAILNDCQRNPFYKGGKIISFNNESEYRNNIRFPDGYGANYKDDELTKVNCEEDCLY